MIHVKRINKNLICLLSLILLLFFISNTYKTVEASVIGDFLSKAIRGSENGGPNSHGFDNSINHNSPFHLNFNLLNDSGSNTGSTSHKNDFHKNSTHDKKHKTIRHHSKG